MRVQKPGRYLGTEIHVVRTKKRRGHCSVCFAFPDLYEIGMSHIGLQILYDIINKMEYAYCERVFAPHNDLESLLRTKRQPLTSLESNTPLHKFDIIGFSLQYELCYTNVLTMLDYGRIPLLARERMAGPLIIAGGTCSLNPEVMADFIDIFVIGEGEDVFPKIIETYRDAKKEKGCFDKLHILHRMSTIPGVYIPSFYSVTYENNNVASFKPIPETIPKIIKKVTVDNYDEAPYPTRPLIPYIQTIHDRACVEIMRGCPHHCKFCQARQYYHPVRIRKPETIVSLAQRIIETTGYDELTLLSLSSGNYPQLEHLLDELQKLSQQRQVSLSLPSIRVEKLITMLPRYLSSIKKSGLTFAPEAGSERLRTFIGKNINLVHLKKTIEEAYRHGYKHIKLYFMIGLPTETYEDLDELVSLVYELAKLRLSVHRQPGNIHVTIGTFIPNPHTTLEYEPMDMPDVIKMKQEYLRQRFRKSYIKYNMTPLAVSLLEAALGRGDRRIGLVIHSAWKQGARFDAWKEHFNFSYWQKAFDDNGFNIEHYATRQIDENAILPWQHIMI